MAQGNGFKLHSAKISFDDGQTWHDVKEWVMGPIYLGSEGSHDLMEITPDNPLYAELVEILEDLE